MKIIGINSSISGTKTSIAMNSLKFSDDVDFEIINLKDLNMSFADGREYHEYDNDNKVLVDKLIQADGIILGTPIYQASIPGVLKNMFDLLPINALQNKTVGIIVNAGSPRHYLVAQQQLIPILNYLKMSVIPKYVFIEPDAYTGEIIRDDIAMRLETLTSKVKQDIESNKKLSQELYDFL